MSRLYSIIVLLCLAAFVLGAYTNKTYFQEVSIVKIKDTKTVIKKIQKPNGEIETITTKETLTNTNSQTNYIPKPKYTIGAMVGADITNLTQPIYGGYVSKQFAGPFSVGVWGMTNGVAGVLVGVSF